MQNPSSTLNPQRLYPTSPSSPASNDHFLTTNNEPSPTPRKRYRSHPGCNLCGMLQTIESVYQQKPNTGGLSASASSGTQGIAPPTTTYSYDHASSGNEISRPPTALGQPGSSTQSLPPFSPPLLSSRITSPPPTAHSTYSNEIKIMNDGRKILLHTEAFTVWESPWDKALVGKKSGLGVEAVASGGRHLVIVINKHVESIYDLVSSHSEDVILIMSWTSNCPRHLWLTYHPPPWSHLLKLYTSLLPPGTSRYPSPLQRPIPRSLPTRSTISHQQFLTYIIFKPIISNFT